MAEETRGYRIIQHDGSLTSREFDVRVNLPSVDEVWGLFQSGDWERAKKSQKYNELSEAEIKEIIAESLEVSGKIEIAARNPKKWDLPQEIVDDTRLIVDFSAPGTYYKPSKKDPFENFEWSRGMDRQRDDTSAILGIYLAGIATGHDFSDFKNAAVLDGLNPELNGRRNEVYEALRGKGLRFVYLGTPEEASAIRRVISKKSSFVPPDLVDVVDEDIINTAGQVVQLGKYLKKNISRLDAPCNIIFPMGIQATRAFPMLKQHDTIPDGVGVSLFPIATPDSGVREFAAMEARGRAFYTLTGDAARGPIPYTLIGAR